MLVPSSTFAVDLILVFPFSSLHCKAGGAISTVVGLWCGHHREACLVQGADLVRSGRELWGVAKELGTREDATWG